jgi:hypothetical protein
MNQQLSLELELQQPAAVLSKCRRYRYVLRRSIGLGSRRVVFVGLNPSTADETSDDPTVRRIVGFARRWGFDRVSLVNLFSLRSTDPRALLGHREPIGAENDSWIEAEASQAELVVVAWGTRGGLLSRDVDVLRLLSDPKCLGKTRDGQPRHPLYLPATAELTDF